MKPNRTIIILAGAVLAGASLWSLRDTNAETKLLPFQGRLTDAAGTAVPDGARVVQFQMYSAPVGGAPVWAGEVQKLTVNRGLVSTLLGSKADLSGVDFAQPVYLQITVDADGDEQITPADPPLLPRQSVLPAVYAVEAGQARDSAKLGGHDWSSILVAGNDPANGQIAADRIETEGITTDQIAADTLNAGDIGEGAVASSEIADGSVQIEDLAQSIQLSIVPPGSVVAYAGTSAPPGWQLCNGAAISRDQFSDLFAVIGTSHGIGDGATTFNLPDYRGRFLRGVDSTELPSPQRDPDRAARVASAAGGNAGQAVGSLQGDAMRAHSHDMVKNIAGATEALTTSDGNFPFVTQGRDLGGQSNYSLGGVNSGDWLGRTDTEGESTENRPINVYVNYIIKS